jgi:hypothetical protein
MSLFPNSHVKIIVLSFSKLMSFLDFALTHKLETVRLLIADDVGIGKSIEGRLIARELLDRGEVKRIAVLIRNYENRCNFLRNI